MLLILGNLYKEPVIQREGDENGTKTQLIITNFNFVDALKQGTLNEDELGTKRNTERFCNIRDTLKAGQRCLVSKLDFQTLTSQKEIDLEGVKDDTAELR